MELHPPLRQRAMTQPHDHTAGAAGGDSYEIACRPAPNYTGRVQELGADLERARADAVRTVCVMRARGSAERVMEILNRNLEVVVDAIFRHDGAAQLTLGPSVYLERGRLSPRATKQIVLSAMAMDYSSRIGWTLAKAQDPKSKA